MLLCYIMLYKLQSSELFNPFYITFINEVLGFTDIALKLTFWLSSSNGAFFFCFSFLSTCILFSPSSPPLYGSWFWDFEFFFRHFCCWFWDISASVNHQKFQYKDKPLFNHYWIRVYSSCTEKQKLIPTTSHEKHSVAELLENINTNFTKVQQFGGSLLLSIITIMF